MQKFWESIRNLIKEITGIELPFQPAIFLLHHNQLPARQYKRLLLPHMINAARLCVTANWKDPDPPQISHWKARLNDIKLIENLMASDIGKRKRFMDRWQWWLEFNPPMVIPRYWILILHTLYEKSFYC